MQNSADTTRRQLFQTTACVLGANIFAPTRRAYAQQNLAQTLVAQAFAARDRGDHHTMLRYILTLVGCACVSGRTAAGLVRQQPLPSHSSESVSTSGITSALHLSERAKASLLSPSVYEQIARQLDHPQEIFQRANYRPVWTQTAQEARTNQNLPEGCTVVPQESRSWKSEFRSTLKNGDRVLSTVDLLLVRDAVGEGVNKAPQTQIGDLLSNVPEAKLLEETGTRLEAVRKQTLQSLGIDKPSKALVALTRADAASYWVKGQYVYGPDMTNRYQRHGKWANGNQSLNSPSRQFLCGDAAVACVYLLRYMEQKAKSEGDATGMQVQSTYGAAYNSSSDGSSVTSDTHGLLGVNIDYGVGKVNLYYSPVPFKEGIGSRFDKTTLGSAQNMGPLDQASVEAFCNKYTVWVLKDEADCMGPKPYNHDGRFTLGENNKIFSLGNFSPFKDGKNGATEVEMNPHPNDGWRPFNSYREQNNGVIFSFLKALNGVFRF